MEAQSSFWETKASLWFWRFTPEAMRGRKLVGEVDRSLVLDGPYALTEISVIGTSQARHHLSALDILQMQPLGSDATKLEKQTTQCIQETTMDAQSKPGPHPRTLALKGNRGKVSECQRQGSDTFTEGLWVRLNFGGQKKFCKSAHWENWFDDGTSPLRNVTPKQSLPITTERPKVSREDILSIYLQFQFLCRTQHIVGSQNGSTECRRLNPDPILLPVHNVTQGALTHPFSGIFISPL